MRLLVDPAETFYEPAYVALLGTSEIRPEPDLRLSTLLAGKTGPRLTSRQTSTEVDLELVLGQTESGISRRVRVTVLSPDDQRLRVSQPEPPELDLAPATPGRTRIRLDWDEGRGSNHQSPPAGILIAAQVVDRRFHLLVPIEIVPENAFPPLVLRADLAQEVDVSFDPLTLRHAAW